MARSHGRISAAIWRDEDWRALPRGPQATYQMLLSQPDLGHCGLIGLAPRRWSRYAADLTAGEIMDDLRFLEANGQFVILDEDTEEVLIRSLIRNDDVWKQPNLMRAAASNVTEIESPKLRGVLLTEIQRVDVGDGTNEQVREVIAALVETLTKGLPEGFDKGLPEGLQDAHVEPPTRARARPLSPIPYPLSPELLGADKPRKQDPIWDAIVAVCRSQDPLTKSARGEINNAVKQLRDVRASPEEITKRAARYRQQYANAALTPSALVKHWPSLVPPPRDPRPECEQFAPGGMDQVELGAGHYGR